MHGHLEGLSKTLVHDTLPHLFNSKPTDQHYHPISLNGGLSSTGLVASFNVLVYEYDYPIEDRADKPQPLKKKAFEVGGSVTWTAAMTLTFLLNASMILAAHVDHSDPVVQCFFMHCFYFSVAWHKETWTWDDIVWLDGLIITHHKLFASVWPDSTIPKFHWILHMAMDIWTCGPIRHITCMRCESKHQYFKRLTSQMNWCGNVPRTMAKRHARYLALQQYLARLKSTGGSGVVVLGGTLHFLVSVKHPSEVLSLLLQVAAVVDRVNSYTGDIAIVQHTKWKYTNQLLQSGTTILFKCEGQVRVASVARLFEVTGLYIITYQLFKTQLEARDNHKTLPDATLEDEEFAMELNTHQLTIAHRCMVGDRCYVLHT